MQRIYVFSTKLQSKAFAGNPGRTIVGPVIEMQIVKTLEPYGLEIAFPPLNDNVRTSCVVTSRGKSRFVDEVREEHA